VLPALSAVSKAALDDEITRYLSAPLERTLNPLLWWTEKKTVYPRLSRMALDYLSIPGTFIISIDI
jgi:hAT family C-terminal dimerisation region